MMRQRRPQKVRSREPRQRTAAKRSTQQLKRWHRLHCVAAETPLSLRAFARVTASHQLVMRAVVAQGWLARKGLV